MFLIFVSAEAVLAQTKRTRTFLREKGAKATQNGDHNSVHVAFSLKEFLVNFPEKRSLSFEP